MIRVSDVVGHWLGLCRRTPAFPDPASRFDDPQSPGLEGSPEGGAGGPNTMRRGFDAALAGAKILVRNRHLFWFAILIGIVLAINLVAQWGLIIYPEVARWILHVDYAYITFLASFAMTYIVGFLAVFCAAFIATWLLLSLPGKNGVPASLARGLARGKDSLVHLAGGSLVAALAGFLIVVQPFLVQEVLFVRNPAGMIVIDPALTRELLSLVLEFLVEFLTVFCLALILAGLLLSIPSGKESHISCRKGLAGVKKHARHLAGWSVVLALAGTVLFSAARDSSPIYLAIWGFASNVFNQFPFNYAFQNIFILDIPVAGLPPGTLLDVWFALGDTVILSAINAFLIVITLFVIPFIVIEGKGLKEAVFGSFALMRKAWREVAACVITLGLALFAVSALFLLFRFSGVDYVWWVSGEMYIAYTNPSAPWSAAGILYVLALPAVITIVATIGGIASLDLYRHAKVREAAA